MARPYKGTTFWDRVYSHTFRLTSQEGGCLLFTGCKDECGYGRIWRDGGLVRVHREVWKREHRSIPIGKVVMHTCDRPNCIEPSHLRLGLQRDNIADMDKKGRRRALQGSQQKSAKLNEQSIPTIRALLMRGDTCKSIANIFGVTEGAIAHVKKGRNWTHVGYGS